MWREPLNVTLILYIVRGISTYVRHIWFYVVLIEYAKDRSDIYILIYRFIYSAGTIQVHMDHLRSIGDFDLGRLCVVSDSSELTGGRPCRHWSIWATGVDLAPGTELPDKSFGTNWSGLWNCLQEKRGALKWQHRLPMRAATYQCNTPLATYP